MSTSSAKPLAGGIVATPRIATAVVSLPPRPANPVTPASDTERDVPFLGTNDGPPRFEPWLGVTLLTFLPGSLIFFLPHAVLSRTLVPICVAMAVFFFAGFGMLLRDKNARRKTSS